MSGGEIFVPKLPSIKIKDLIKAMTDSSDYNLIGIKTRRKLHEVMIPKEKSLKLLRHERSIYY